MNNKKNVIAGGVIVGVLVLLALFSFLNRKPQVANNSVSITPTQAVIPTVDSSVKVTLESTTQNKETTLAVNGIPKGTTSIEYELSYNTASQGLQGVIGTIELKKGESEVEKELTLGTCSSGTCVYHSVVGAIQVSLKFNGSYGEKIFEKEFELESE